jgi:hypothetical protein
MLRTFEPLDTCVYCGATDGRLTDEHIVPFALNGTLILPRASCDACSSITSQFERSVARSMYGTLRVKRGFKTRRRKERPTSIPAVEIDKGGMETPTTISASLLPTTYIAIEFPPPGILTGAPKSPLNPDMKLHFKCDTKEAELMARTLDVGQLELSAVAVWGHLCRLVAKIGHTYAAAVLRGAGYEPLLNAVILGRSEDLSYYVGGITGPAPASELSLKVMPVGGEHYLTVEVVLLGKGRLPPYQAIAGRVTDLKTIMDRVQQ